MLYTLCDWDMKHREENTGPKNAIFYLLMQGIGTAKRFMAGTELVSDSRFPYCYLIRGWKSRKIEDTWMKILAKFKQTQFSSLLKKVHPLRAGDRLPKDGRRRAQCSNWWLKKNWHLKIHPKICNDQMMFRSKAAKYALRRCVSKL